MKRFLFLIALLLALMLLPSVSAQRFHGDHSIYDHYDPDSEHYGEPYYDNGYYGGYDSEYEHLGGRYGKSGYAVRLGSRYAHEFDEDHYWYGTNFDRRIYPRAYPSHPIHPFHNTFHYGGYRPILLR